MNLSKEGAFICYQLKNDDKLSDKQYNSIAELVFNTDPYIYPAMFGEGNIGRSNAIIILSELYKNGLDAMFCLNNLYVAMIDNNIVGLILWYKGVLEWSYEELLKVALNHNIYLDSNNLQLVKEHYFTEKYSKDDLINESISLINVCVNSLFQGLGIGRYMLNEFIKSNLSDEYKLCVIADNNRAVKLYLDQGFVINKELEGFSLNREKPRCYDMSMSVCT